MNNKKIISLTLSALMLSPTLYAGSIVNASVMAKSKLVASSPAVTSANNTQSSILTKEQIERLMRDKLQLDSSYKLTSSNLTIQDLNQKQIWNLSFSSDNKYVNVYAYAYDGQIINLNKNEDSSNNSTFTILPNDAEKIASDYIKKMEPDKSKEVTKIEAKKGPSIVYNKIRYWGSNDYSFMFVRNINGEAMPNNYFSVTVSGTTGNITNYEFKWDDAFNNNTNVMSENDVRKIFEAKNNLALKYVSFYDENNKDIPDLTPVYFYDTSKSDKLNAVSGKLINNDDLYSWSYYPGPYYLMDSGAINAKKELSNTSAAPAELIPEDGVLSREKAEKLIFNAVNDDNYTKNLKVESSRYTANFNSLTGKYWYITFANADNSSYLSGTVDALKSKVISINYGQNNVAEKRSDNTKIDTAAVTKILENKLSKMLPDLKSGKDYKIALQTDSKTGICNFRSSRYINGIPYDGNYIDINYDSLTQKITNFSYVWYDVNAKYSDSIINTASATKIFLDKVGLEKYLVQLKDQDSLKKNKLNIPLKNTVLVYSPKSFDFSYIDALSGKFLGSDGKEYTSSTSAKYELTDIDNSTYKNEISLMNQMGKLELGSDIFNPNGKLLKKDAIKWISLLTVNKFYDPLNEKANPKYDAKLNYKDLDENSPYYNYINNAWKAGIFEKDGDYFNGDSVVTKEDVTRWIINALGMKRYAQYTKMFEVSYKDAASLKSDFKGYAALADYYNLFGNKGIDTAFDSAKIFNRDEFVSILYHYMLNNL